MTKVYPTNHGTFGAAGTSRAPGSSRGGTLRARSFRGGAAIVELALTLGILFSVVYGTIEFGYYFFVKNTMEAAAREGCRAAIVSGGTNNSATTAAINQMVGSGLLPSGATTMGNYTLSTTPSTIYGTSIGTEVTVTITATWGTVGSGFRPAQIIGASKTISAACSMRKEGSP
jgi:Flp pilus assembly protein TadG